MFVLFFCFRPLVPWRNVEDPPDRPSSSTSSRTSTLAMRRKLSTTTSNSPCAPVSRMVPSNKPRDLERPVASRSEKLRPRNQRQRNPQPRNQKQLQRKQKQNPPPRRLQNPRSPRVPRKPRQLSQPRRQQSPRRKQRPPSPRKQSQQRKQRSPQLRKPQRNNLLAIMNSFNDLLCLLLTASLITEWTWTEATCSTYNHHNTVLHNVGMRGFTK